MFDQSLLELVRRRRCEEYGLHVHVKLINVSSEVPEKFLSLRGKIEEPGSRGFGPFVRALLARTFGYNDAISRRNHLSMSPASSILATSDAITMSPMDLAGHGLPAIAKVHSGFR